MNTTARQAFEQALEQTREAVAPDGWEKTVKKMKKHPEIDNPWALAWWMKGQGHTPGGKQAGETMNARTTFEDALIATRIATRFAMEHSSPEALKEYLKEHPGADRSNHSVKKSEPTESAKSMKDFQDAGSKSKKEHVEGVGSHLAPGGVVPLKKHDPEALAEKHTQDQIEKSLEAVNARLKHVDGEDAEDFKKTKKTLEKALKLKKAEPKAESAHREAGKAKARYQASEKHYESMKDLQKPVDNAKPSARKKFDKAYDEILSNGTASAKAAEKLLKTYQGLKDGSRDDAASLSMLGGVLDDWLDNVSYHEKVKAPQFVPSHKLLQQAEKTLGYAWALEKWIGTLSERVGKKS